MVLRMAIDACMAGSNIIWVLRPPDLALYKAMSARFINSSGLQRVSQNKAMPMLAEILCSPPWST